MKRILAVVALALSALTIVGASATQVTANDVHHPDCPGLVKDIAPGDPTPIAGIVYVKAGDDHYNVGFQAAGYVAGPQGGHGVSHVDVCPPPTPTTTTTTAPTTTTTLPGTTTTTTSTTLPQCPEEPCVPNTNANTTTTTTATGATTTTVTTSPSSTSSTSTSTTTSTSSVPPTTLPDVFEFGAAATVCVNEVPTIRITFLNTFPDLAGQTGLLTLTDVNGVTLSTQSLVYEPGTTVDILYPGTSVNPDGSIDDVPGWILNDDGFWLPDPSDEYLREGIGLTYEVNPTASTFVTYPPESSACADPDGPFPPNTPRVPTGALPPTR